MPLRITALDALRLAQAHKQRIVLVLAFFLAQRLRMRDTLRALKRLTRCRQRRWVRRHRLLHFRQRCLVQ